MQSIIYYPVDSNGSKKYLLHDKSPIHLFYCCNLTNFICVILELYVRYYSMNDEMQNLLFKAFYLSGHMIFIF